jgi:hypothetical protein
LQFDEAGIQPLLLYPTEPAGFVCWLCVAAAVPNKQPAGLCSAVLKSLLALCAGVAAAVPNSLLCQAACWLCLLLYQTACRPCVLVLLLLYQIACCTMQLAGFVCCCAKQPAGVCAGVVAVVPNSLLYHAACWLCLLLCQTACWPCVLLSLLALCAGVAKAHMRFSGCSVASTDQALLLSHQ